MLVECLCMHLWVYDLRIRITGDGRVRVRVYVFAMGLTPQSSTDAAMVMGERTGRADVEDEAKRATKRKDKKKKKNSEKFHHYLCKGIFTHRGYCFSSQCNEPINLMPSENREHTQSNRKELTE